MLRSLCGWRDLSRGGFVWASFHSFVFFLSFICHFAFASNFPFFWTWCVHAVFVWVHPFTNCVGIRLDEWVRKDFSLSPYETGQTQGKEICVREQRGILLAHDTLSFLHGWLSHAFPSFLTCYLQWCMPDLSRISFVLFTHCFCPFKIFLGVSRRLVHCAGHPTFLSLLLLLSPHLVDIFHLAEESNFAARLLVH